MIEPKILYKGDFTKENVQLEFAEKKHSFRPEFETKVAQLWSDFLAEAHLKGISPWDGSYVAIDNVNEFVQTWILKLYNVNYSRIRALVALSKDNELSEEEHLNHISTGAVIETNDGYFVMGQRGLTMHQTTVDFIGGGLQDDEIEVKEFSDFEKNVLKEMHEEANITVDVIESVKGIGVVFSNSTNIIFFYKVNLKITADELKEIFKGRTEDEMSDLLLMKKEEFKSYVKTLTSYRPLISDLLD